MALKFKKRPYTEYIVVHCSATQNKSNIDRATIAQWHRGQGWMDIGYHFVIKTDGTVEVGRDIDVVGSHVKGHNETSVGICLVGGVDRRGVSENNFNDAQFDSLRKLITELKLTYPDAKVVGHRDFAGVHKDCPCFDVRLWLSQDETRHTKNIVVAKGDTLFSLAKAHNTTVDNIKSLNDMVNDNIKIGEIIKVPARQ